MHSRPGTKLDQEYEAHGIEGNGLRHVDETAHSNGSKRLSTRLWEVIPLPDAKYAYFWNCILRSKDTKQPLHQFIIHTKELADHGIARRELDQSGVILICGAPGVGKTTIAKGFANEFAKIQGQPTRLFTLHTEHLLSELLGQSAKELGKAFEGLRFAAEQGPCVLLVDEIEAISFARNKVINSSDPSDLVRFVDQLFRDIDSLQPYPHAVVVGTSNFPDVIDEAFLSRADLVLKMPLPDLQTRQAILQARCKTLMPLGLMLQSDELLAIAKASEGLSGRTIGKLFSRTFFAQWVSYEDMRVEDVLTTITQAHMKESTNGSCKRHPVSAL
jgi:SpoVK/Ycf46/Vps4 family AAA+-type ATPase